MTQQRVSSHGVLLACLALGVAVVLPATRASAQGTRAAAPPVATTQAACDPSAPQAGRAMAAAYNHPFTRAAPSGARARHAVLGPDGPPTGGAGARRQRVRKDGGEVVAKDRRPVVARADSTLWCPQLAATPRFGGGETTGEVPALPTMASAPGEVLPSPQLPGSVARRGPRFFLPPLLGGALLGGSAIALANRPRGGTTATPLIPVTPVVPLPPTTPATPVPTTPPPTGPTSPPPTAGPTTPAGPTSPTTPTPGAPTTPPTPTTPLAPSAPESPTVPTATVPEPATVALVAAGLTVLGAVRERRRRAMR